MLIKNEAFASLVGQLHDEHIFIVNGLEEAWKIGIDSDKGKAKLLSLKTKLFEHLDKEDRVFYPMLKSAAKDDSRIDEALDVFGRGLGEISKSCKDFFSRYPQPCQAKNCDKDFQDIFSLLKQRMRKEELVLFNVCK
ncbi:MAG: hypothetical protein COV72_04700 [Candidatus Omnitrophica bacterium CG11_big_fil_rev_8_21_14_0_20_42_13]|uniref:Hemerythrin-like domain-containing protein n=1 Tax=Candidatus Ghiorseimicrobium undicola TaxID=1974746 RepID=A0A2H0LXJ4_9BACT|nr:MAG: hypothetical protein COV72_04700 [Candidatus Omnitrophica bacterium CG11_big_fil_rev_8_21_14_0_20_42_13]